MKKILIIGVGVIVLGILATVFSCEKDDGYASCGSNTCTAARPYSNADASVCYPTKSACETATGKDCKDCN